MFVDGVNVEVVNVDVLVTDRDGRPVRGLQRANFQLLVDKAALAIEYFTAPPPLTPQSPALPAPTPEPEAPPPPRRAQTTLAIFVDQSALEPGQRGRAVKEIGELIESQGDELWRVMLAAFAHTFRIVCPPTSERATLAAAVKTLEDLPLQGFARASERAVLTRTIAALPAAALARIIHEGSAAKSVEMLVMVGARRGEGPSRTCLVRRRLRAPRPRGGWVGGEKRAAGPVPMQRGTGGGCASPWQAPDRCSRNTACAAISALAVDSS